jgi:hypothetical protein
MCLCAWPSLFDLSALNGNKFKLVPVNAMEAYRGSGVIGPFILYVNDRWR